MTDTRLAYEIKRSERIFFDALKRQPAEERRWLSKGVSRRFKRRCQKATGETLCGRKVKAKP